MINAPQRMSMFGEGSSLTLFGSGETLCSAYAHDCSLCEHLAQAVGAETLKITKGGRWPWVGMR